ncbi:MAG TPA: protein kinase, partial [Negativicutes bacterium]|nr:protein kinase [Negativicutes bacterium]
MYSSNYKTIRGRWSGKNYIVQKKLGAGGIGEIFMVKDDFGMPYAMKVSSDLVSITKEYGYLERFSAMRFAPKAYELDDCEKDNRVCHYFVMEYVDGDTLRAILSKEKLSFGSKLDIARIITDVLRGINERGYVYTDLKFENIMLDRKNRRIRLIDLGSITHIGDRVKEYTAMYDRGSWKAGGRIADLSYQVFAVAILLIAMLLSRDIDPEKEQLGKILRQLEKAAYPRELYTLLSDCLEGRISDCCILYERLGEIPRRISPGKKLTYALNAVIA